MDICLGGIVDRNRALNGDVVVVQLKPKTEWRILLSDLRNYLLRNNLTALENLTPPKFSPKKKSFLKKLTSATPTTTTTTSSNTNQDLSAEHLPEKTSRRKKKDERKVKKVEVIDEQERDVVAEIVKKRTRRSKKKKVKAAITEIIAQDHTQVPLNSQDKENVNESDDVGSHEDLIEFSESVEQLPRESPNQHLDDVYYPSLLQNDEKLLKDVIVDNFDWAELLRGRSVEELSVEELLKIPSAKNFVQPTAKVVFLVRKCHNRTARGHLKTLSSNLALFQPVDHRFPFLRIPASKCPNGFFDSPNKFRDTLFLAKMIDWQKPTEAAGEICCSVGCDGDLQAECSALLLESGIETDEFTQDIMDDLPINFPFSITQDEVNVRRDYRNDCVFTVDPATARDLDDAISCDVLDDGLLKVGVHIADVGYFVIPGSKVDAKASLRSTSVYLVSQVIPMLPRLLCEELCSLRPGTDRLCLSVEWEIRESDGAILSEWFGHSLIRSCAQLSYEHAQSMIDGKEDKDLIKDRISSPWSTSDVSERVRKLHDLALKLRRKRASRGALRLDQSRLIFGLGEDGLPDKVGSYQLRDSNRLIEELMILANIAVARRIYKQYPHLAVLRNHPQPVKRALDEVVDMLKPCGVHLDPQSSHTLQISLGKYSGEDEASFARHQLITYLLTKPMKLANYFCSGALSNEKQYFHYALSVPLYTHFTSPIRRYPDILVHRLLTSALNDASLPVDSARVALLQQLMAHCNQAKTTAKTTSEKCNEIYLSAYIRKLGSLESEGIVCGVMDQSFDVLLYNMGLVKRVYCDQLNTLKQMEMEDGSAGCKILKLTFSDGMVHLITLFTLVKVMLMGSETDSNKIVACLQCVL